ncbi:hypothetical protein [Nocardia gipuzkoensis]
MSKVDDVVNKINEGYEPSSWGSPNSFKLSEAQDSLDALAGLNADEFEEVYSKLQANVRASLAYCAGDLKNDPKYADIIKALEGGDPTAVVKVKNEAETPKFPDGYGRELEDETEHLYRVDLYQPKGASAMLIALIDDTQFTMQWSFDTLGVHDPKAAPDFSNVLDGKLVTTAEGWSEIRTQHQDLVEQLTKRQDDYTKDHKAVDIEIADSKMMNEAVWKNLKRIVDDLNYALQLDLSGPTSKRDGDKIKHPNLWNSPVGDETVYEKGEGGKFFLTPLAEQQYYVKEIDYYAEMFDEEYDKAIKDFQKKAENVDNKNANDNSNNNNNNYNNYPPPYQTTYTPPATTITAPTGNEDFSSTFDDLLGGSTDQTGLLDGTQSTLGGGMTSAALGGGSGNGTGAVQATPAVSTAPAGTGGGGGSDLMGQMIMMNALSQMGNQSNRVPTDDNGRDDKESREARQRERERRERTGPAATVNSGAQTAPPGVAASAYAGTPPAVTTPGTMVDHPIGDKTVKVPPVVAEALQRQQTNVAIDAESAYAGTAGENSPEDHPWATVNDLSKLAPGDVVQWEKHSALIVRDENGLNILENGLLVTLDPNNPPLTEKYGSFTGFYHPTGLDVGSNPDPGSAAAAPPPPVASQAQPAGPPPVTPPQQI